MESDKHAAVSFGELWDIQESLLQAYRSIFITVESAIIAVTTFLLSADSPKVYVVLPVIILGLSLIPIWIGVCGARARAVTFIHWLIQKHEAGETITTPYSHFRQFQENRIFKDKNVIFDHKFIKLSKSLTRKRLDFQVPLVFVAIWIMLLLVTLSESQIAHFFS